MSQVLERSAPAPFDDHVPQAAPAARRASVGAARSRNLAWFGAGFALYCAAGWNLAIVHHAIVGDAMARVANAYYVGFSRDPHLAAVGFVWNPLPSFAAFPLVALSRWWPALRTQGFAGNLVSAGFMAGSVAVIAATLQALHVRRVVRVLLVLTYALHPIVVLYGGNGDSEATLLFFLALTCFALIRWLDRRDLRSLLLLGIALGLGYLSRQEFLAAGSATILVVVVVTFRAAAGPRRQRGWTAATEGALAALPFGFSVVCWAASAWILVGSATSYLEVNRQQVLGARAGIIATVGGTGTTDRLVYTFRQVGGLEPLAALVIVAAVALAVRRRDPRVVAPLVTFGAVLVTQVVLFANESTFGWLRFSITIVPLTVVLGGLMLGTVDPAPDDASTGRVAPRPARLVATAAAVLVLVAGIAAFPSAASVMGDARLAREEAGLLRLVPGYDWAPGGTGAYGPDDYIGFDRVVRDLEQRRLRDGAVLTDTQYTFPLILKSPHPRQFVIPSDFDFERSVADPSTYHVRYLLLSDGSADVIARSYPELRTRPRNAIARLVRTFHAGVATL
ncbi:MAG: glycosyltransferase family 39 protein, partial [Acidimicrobiia bacterium]